MQWDVDLGCVNRAGGFSSGVMQGNSSFTNFETGSLKLGVEIMSGSYSLKDVKSSC